MQLTEGGKDGRKGFNCSVAVETFSKCYLFLREKKEGAHSIRNGDVLYDDEPPESSLPNQIISNVC